MNEQRKQFNQIKDDRCREQHSQVMESVLLFEIVGSEELVEVVLGTLGLGGEPGEDVVVLGLVLSCHPQDVALQDPLLCLFASHICELLVGVGVVRAEDTLQVTRNHNFLLLSVLEYQFNFLLLLDLNLDHFLFLFPLPFDIFLLQLHLNRKGSRGRVPNLDKRMIFLMTGLPLALLTKIKLPTNTAFESDAHDGMNSAIVAYHIVNYNTFFFFRLVHFLFLFWLIVQDDLNLLFLFQGQLHSWLFFLLRNYLCQFKFRHFGDHLRIGVKDLLFLQLFLDIYFGFLL